MTEIFGQLARAVSGQLKFTYMITEEENVVTYLNQLYKEQTTRDKYNAQILRMTGYFSSFHFAFSVISAKHP
jgi:hypothetical protein